MGVEALTHRDDGTPHDPTLDGWDGWVSASATRNYALHDPILDWLDLYGEAKGYQPDHALPGYDPRTDFREFLFAQGREFEARVIAHLQRETEIRTITDDHLQTRTCEAAEATFAAMHEGVPALYQGVLWDAEHGAFGAPDLLVRADILERWFPGTLTPKELEMPAPDLGGRWHYRVVDVKFSTLHLNAAGSDLTNGGSMPAYKTQLFLYNRALGRIQGYEPPATHLIGRSWERTQKKIDYRGDSAFSLVASLPQSGETARNRPTSATATGALHWVRRLRAEGADWLVTPVPSVRELYPDAGNAQDAPWHAAKRQIAREIEELTLLWQVGVEKREQAHGRGIVRWTDPRLTPEDVGIKAPSAYYAPFAALLDINRSADGPLVRRGHQTDAESWRPVPLLEFFADFETFGDLRDHFDRFPERGGQTLIFMIGCGHIEDGKWQFRCFVADAETEEAEACMIDAWLEHMESVRGRLAPDLDAPRLTHWSRAEPVTFETAYNAAKARHPEKHWPSPNWFDFLDVMRKDPVVIRGAMGFGLKAVARALHSHGLIETVWGDGPTDGLGAMMGGWWCYDEAVRRSVPVASLDLMKEIVAYNEVDCRSMQEVVHAVRALE
ncbi:MAG: hypothetical protein EPO16_13155 [Dehalococcoidia bacterium]|nr:MAG: hypothetical protein EPO16_13155 [Dehalococcoidia bacterium]